MAPPCVAFFTLAEVCDRWGMKPVHVGTWALEGKLILSVGLANVSAEVGSWFEVDTDCWERYAEGRRCLTGIFDLERDDAWTVIKNGSHLVRAVVADAADGYVHLQPISGDGGVQVATEEILVRRPEVERFEAENGMGTVPEPAREAGGRGGPGAPTRFDWEAFWIEVCRRIYEDGLPPSQAAMARDMLDWFTETGGAVPDLSTVKKKISRLWRALGRLEMSRGRVNVA